MNNAQMTSMNFSKVSEKDEEQKSSGSKQRKEITFESYERINE
jgi:hypothetical protein